MDEKSVAKAIEGYRALRDTKKIVSDRHRAELEPINEKLYQLEVWLLSTLNSLGVESMKTVNGTAYKSRTVTVKAEDPEAFRVFIQENNLLHMIENRPSKAAIEEFIEAEGVAPPGISVTTDVRINVRK